MKITLSYFAQVRQAAGVESETIDVVDGADVAVAIGRAAEIHGEAFRSLVLAENGLVRPGMIVLVNSVPVPHGTRQQLTDGDSVSVFSPVAGG